MIRWLIQSAPPHFDLAAGDALVGMLSAEEYTRFLQFKSEKRRREWLLGRWTAKLLLQAHIEEREGWRPALARFIIGSESSGAPFASLVADDRSPRRLPLSLSISHSNGYGFAALHPTDERAVQVGADMELVEPRSWRFVEDFFTDEESEMLLCAPESTRDMLATAIWSAKEATLKALRLGLSVDTRCVSCLIEPAARADWTPFSIHRHEQPTQEPYCSIPLSGWWRVLESPSTALFTLTLVVAG
jgi:4'-phosphopantetheinyl transferase